MRHWHSESNATRAAPPARVVLTLPMPSTNGIAASRHAKLWNSPKAIGSACSMPKDYKDLREAYEDDWESDRFNRDEAANDAEFLVGDPWPTKIRQQREKAGRPVHSVN